METPLLDYYANLRSISDGYVHPDLARYLSQLSDDGIDVTRQWKSLPYFSPLWRAEYDVTASAAKPSKRILSALRKGKISPIVFSDVDHAILSRDVQRDADEKIGRLTTLEILGCVAHHFNDLQNREIHLAEIRASPRYSERENKEQGQDLLHWSITTTLKFNITWIRTEHRDEMHRLAQKDPRELTDADFDFCLGAIVDGVYRCVIDPLVYQLGKAESNGSAFDIQNGTDRMHMIYKIMSAISHVAPEQVNKFRHEDFFRFELDDFIYPGVVDLFDSVESTGCGLVAITRGNQFAFMGESSHGLSELYHRTYSTLLWTSRKMPVDPNVPEPSVFYPKKKLRPYSTKIDSLDSRDKLRIMVHEALMQFDLAGITFSSDRALVRALATYFDHCVFITDTDVEAWGTTPIIQVQAERSPDRDYLRRIYPDLLPEPIVRVDPKHLLDGYDRDTTTVDTFSPRNPIMNSIVNSLKNRQPLTPFADDPRGLAREIPALTSFSIH